MKKIHVVPAFCMFVLCLFTSTSSTGQELPPEEDIDQGITGEVVELPPGELDRIMDSLPPPPETPFEEMIRLCKNKDANNRVIDPGESKKDCRQRYRKLRQEYRRATRKMCRNIDSYRDPDVQAVVRDACNKFGTEDLEKNEV
jgi:hypothetical protein